MIYFQCDYEEGCHPEILKRLSSTNLEQTVGYGMDQYCESAREKIKAATGRADADVHFLVGGTQTNTAVIAAALRPWQGVICADTGHIACHETGAIEAVGHKVLTLPSTDGKINASQVDEAIKKHFADATHEHIVQPGLVYISFPTESGTLYSKKELSKLWKVCREHSVYLYIDGARLGYGLESPACDLTLRELAGMCDVFYIGGTKCGTLFGEAVVINNDALKPDFRYNIKQRGGMFAKGRLLGVQFDTLFTDNLYSKICRSAVDKALAIRKAFIKKGIVMYGSSMTNQQFPQLTDEQIKVLEKDFAFEYWGQGENGKSIVRFCTSWATTDEQVKALTDAIEGL